jgi:hypothetical protein
LPDFPNWGASLPDLGSGSCELNGQNMTLQITNSNHYLVHRQLNAQFRATASLHAVAIACTVSIP